jgi:predicted RecB family nuclease
VRSFGTLAKRPWRAQGTTNMITATDFYRYLVCPHWPWFERHANAEDRALKRELTRGEERRLDDGYSHERDVMQELFATQSVKALGETGNVQALFAATKQAMEEGAAFIYQGTLLHGDWLGRPDILMRVDGASTLGNWHYVPVDIKTAHELKPAHRHQLYFYSVQLEAIQGVFPEKAGIVNRDKQWFWFEPSEHRKDFEEVLAQIQRIDAGEKPPLVLRKTCMDVSPWGKACQHQAEEAQDIALLYNVDVKKLAFLRAMGIHTVQDAAELSVESLAGSAPGLTARSLEVARLQARALRDGTVFIKEPSAFPSSRCELYFDIESDLPNDADYLYGFLINDETGVRYERMLAERPEQEGEMWRAFLTWLTALPSEYVVYHYAPYEVMRLNLLESRYGGSEALNVFRERMIDLKPMVTKRVTFPLYFYGLKYMCKFLGFRWTGELQSGGESIEWYERWCETGDRSILDQIVHYNEDDVYATKFLKEWLERFGHAVTSYDPPYAWKAPTPRGAR